MHEGRAGRMWLMALSPVIPTLRYRDASAAITFLVEGLEFRLTARYPADGEPVDHAELVRGDGMVMVGSVSAAELELPVGGSSIYLVVDTDADVDRLYERAIDAGAADVIAPRAEDYGGRGASVRDVEGNAWSIGSYRPDA
jgi:uncharacterized glyoxalase superfamily protein PhnB